MKLKKMIKLGKNGAKAVKITKNYIFPWSLVAFAAFAYAKFDVPIPKKKKTKN